MTTNAGGDVSLKDACTWRWCKYVQPHVRIAAQTTTVWNPFPTYKKNDGTFDGVNFIITATAAHTLFKFHVTTLFRAGWPMVPGMYEFWHELLQGEEESPTIRFKGKTERYSWKQNAETIEVSVTFFSVSSDRRQDHLSVPASFSVCVHSNGRATCSIYCSRSI